MFTTMTPPWTHDALRVGGYPLPDRDFHPGRDAKLTWRENARFQARERAGARYERTLFPVACKPLIMYEAPPSIPEGML
jgi:hypothetical protein